MKKKTRLTVYLVATLLVGPGCVANSETNSQTILSNKHPAKLVSQTTTQKLAQATPTTPSSPAQATPTPTPPEQKTLPKPIISGLTPSTNPDTRRSKIDKKRSDPFQAVSIPVKVSNIPSPNAPSAAQPTPPVPKPVAQGPQKPQKPQPDLARQVVISGLVDINGKPKLIVKAPNEPFSRYVEPGQYVSNGKVFIKKVKMFGDSSPVVILEESGIEVMKKVGENT